MKAKHIEPGSDHANAVAMRAWGRFRTAWATATEYHEGAVLDTGLLPRVAREDYRRRWMASIGAADCEVAPMMSVPVGREDDVAILMVLGWLEIAADRGLMEELGEP